MALHCARQADPERLHRKLQRPPARRTSQRDAVHLARAGSGRAGHVDGRLQHRSSTQLARRPHTERIYRSQCLPTATGRCAALRRGLRAPPRCSTEPSELKCHRDSTCRRMKVGAQVRNDIAPGVSDMRYRLIPLAMLFFSALTTAGPGVTQKLEVKGMYLLTDYPAISVRPGTTASACVSRRPADRGGAARDQRQRPVRASPRHSERRGDGNDQSECHRRRSK